MMSSSKSLTSSAFTVGLGLYKVEPVETRALVDSALDTGYRLFDTATFYGNDTELGQSIRSSGIRREELFITSKAWVDELGKRDFRKSLSDTLDRTGLDYLDCFMIHWPAPKRDQYVEAFEAMIELQQEGLISHLSVSNFHIEHLQRLQTETGHLPALHQLELHPYLQQTEMLSFHKENGIATQAWSPLARGLVLQDEEFAKTAQNEVMSSAQLALAWSMSKGVMVVPKASSSSRLQENFDSQKLDISASLALEVSGYDRGYRTGVDPNDRN